MDSIDNLASERLRLRRFVPGDAAFVFELHQNPDLVRFIPSNAMTHADQAPEWIERVNAQSSAGRGWWCVTQHDGTPVGAVVVKPVGYSKGRGGDEIEIGWRWHADHTGRGYATEAAKLLLDVTLAGGLRRLIAVVRPDNTASQAVCRRIGMTRVGLSTDYYDTEVVLFETRG